jgi:hypothetical protein
MDDAPLAQFFEITISESMYLNSRMHWLFENS